LKEAGKGGCHGIRTCKIEPLLYKFINLDLYMQKIYFLIIENYIYLVPHIIEKEYIFLELSAY